MTLLSSIRKERKNFRLNWLSTAINYDRNILTPLGKTVLVVLGLVLFMSDFCNGSSYTLTTVLNMLTAESVFQLGGPLKRRSTGGPYVRRIHNAMRPINTANVGHRIVKREKCCGPMAVGGLYKAWST